MAECALGRVKLLFKRVLVQRQSGDMIPFKRKCREYKFIHPNRYCRLHNNPLPIVPAFDPVLKTSMVLDFRYGLRSSILENSPQLRQKSSDRHPTQVNGII